MAQESDLERTEEPTARRLEKAREEGQVPQSRELSSFLVLISAVAVAWMAGGWMAGHLQRMMAQSLTLGYQELTSVEPVTSRLAESAFMALLSLSPLFAGVVLAALATPFLMNSWIFSPKAFAPKFSRLNPISGFGRILSVQGLAELVKALLKTAVIGGVAAWLLWTRAEEFMSVLAQPVDVGLLHALNLILFCFSIVVATMVLIVAADVPYQFWRYHEQLKMTKEEVKRESKEMEGDPHVKGRIRALQREAARRRMMASVPSADVVVTNPTHFSVALSYKSGMAAPKVVAKGRGEIALRIREVAGEAGVPMLEAPALARALYRWAEIDDDVPVRLYAAVAEVLAYVYQLNQYRKMGGGYPKPPVDLPVPPELDPELVHG